jgi:hypothetical protein
LCGCRKEVKFGEGKVLLSKVGGQIYATSSQCSHYGAPLASELASPSTHTQPDSIRMLTICDLVVQRESLRGLVESFGTSGLASTWSAIVADRALLSSRSMHI